MITAFGNHITDLYTKNILSELFPEFCFSETKNINCEVSVQVLSKCVKAKITVDGNTYTCSENFSDHINDRLALTTAIGKSVIKYATEKGRPSAPYGVLTGVRPFKIAVDLLSRFDYDEVIKKLKSNYLVADDKIELLLSVAMYDQKVKLEHQKNDVSVYVSIPFCPTRCNYCSFISSAAPSKLDLLGAYVDDLLKEIEAVADLINRRSLNLKSIYIGGGTPTVLNKELLNKLLNHIASTLPVDSLIEYTLEAGRPDTIDTDKLDVMKSHGVTRTCVNCQSTNDGVLSAIGRAHTAEQFFKAFETVKSYGFDTVNTDVIAGLDTDTFETFKKTIDDVISLSPESITVHTLCVKKSAALKNGNALNNANNVDAYLSYSKESCISRGLLPYYLYKQKYSLGNHENVGYCLNSHECHYNIAMMNEIEHIIGVGAGSTSRLVGLNSNGKIEHFANYKYPMEYIGDYEKIKNNVLSMEKLLNQNP